MLKKLYIKNFTLISELDIEFSEGFSVITGETGAGKSIVLGAIGLLLGQRADSKSIKQGAEKCVIEAHFDLSRYPMTDFFNENDIEQDAADTIVRRELMASGKSRAFINDTPVPLALLKELGEQLVDVHSQHQNLLLGKQDFQLNVVDILAQDTKQLEAYQQSFALYQQAKRRLAELKDSIERNRQNQDFLQFQFDELANARLAEGEQEELERRSETMSHSEDIKTALYEADHALSGDENGIVSQLKTAVGALSGIAKVFPQAAELTARLDSSYIELKDVSQEVGSLLEDIDFDPSELDAVNARLDKLYDLQKKYRVETVEALLAIKADLEQKLSTIENSDEALAEQEAELEAVRTKCCQQADVLTNLRQQAARQIEQEMRQRLVPLGMPNVRFEIAVTKSELSHNGQDSVSFSLQRQHVDVVATCFAGGVRW